MRPPNGWRLYSGNFSVGRQNFLDSDAFDVRMGHVRGEDVELGLRLESLGTSFHHSPEAAAIHRGYRPFESWKNSAFILGPRDIFLAKEKGFDHILDGVRSAYARRSSLFKTLLRAYVKSDTARKIMIGTIKRVCGMLGSLSARSLAHTKGTVSCSSSNTGAGWFLK